MTTHRHRFREEVINVQLAQLLASRGLEANAETIQKKGRPDILISMDGLKLILEGRVVTQRRALVHDAKKRIEEGIADISMAIFYPEELQAAESLADLARKIETAHYSGEVFYLNHNGVTSTSFVDASLDEVIQTINNAFVLRVQNDVVREHVTRLEETLEAVVSTASSTSLFFDSDVLVTRLRQALGVDPDAQDENEDAE